jgi:hypothetical protein
MLRFTVDPDAIALTRSLARDSSGRSAGAGGTAALPPTRLRG